MAKTIQQEGNSIVIIHIPETKSPIHSYGLVRMEGSNLSWLHLLDANKKDLAVPLELIGEYQLIGRGSEISEEQWQEILLKHPTKHWFGYQIDYPVKGTHSYFTNPSAKEVGHKFLQEHGFIPIDCLVLKQVSQ